MSELHLGEVKNLSTVIADRLADMIHAGQLQPAEHLVQIDLAERFGVSRVAVRDALQELVQRGLATKIPRKGTIVRPVSCNTVRDIFAARRVVEAFAAKEAAKNMSASDMDVLAQLIDEQERLAEEPDPLGLIETDWEFHRRIYDHCRNEPLKEIIANLWSRSRQARGLALVDTSWGRKWGKRSAARHRKLLEALRQRNEEQITAVIVNTIALAEEELVRGLKESGRGDGE